MKLSGEHLREVSFPVGGIGAGCIGMSGDGRLWEWEIFNHAGKGLHNGNSHFAVRAESKSKVLDTRLLQGDLLTELSGERNNPHGFGWGPVAGLLATFPHFAKVELDARFPIAEYTFLDSHFPGQVRLRAYSPFIPGESDLASLPVAIFEVEIKNTSREEITFTCAGSLSNPWKVPGATNRFVRKQGISSLLLENHQKRGTPEFGELSISTDEPKVSYQEYWYRRDMWRDHLEVYWHDLTSAGPLPKRHFPPRTETVRFEDTGTLASRAAIAPGKTHVFRFVISWYLPERVNEFPTKEPERLAQAGLRDNTLHNYYARLCRGAVDAAKCVFSRFDSIRDGVRCFCDTLHASTLPAAALEGAAANLAVLVSPTVLRLDNGTIWGWEGVGATFGSCEGTCQHVWNYAQALPLLFPDLERTIRESHADYSLDEDGRWHFRLPLPLGVKSRKTDFRACVDGSFGEIMKIFREWKVSGDQGWLERMWPAVKRAIEFAWSPVNDDRWDPKRTGVLTGRQHHTLDMELFGPSGWLQGIYLGALKAASLMARACNDSPFAVLCEKVFAKGRAWTEKHLFNGEYYNQQVDIHSHDTLKPYTSLALGNIGIDTYWDAEHSQLKYQIADGCSIDSHLGQWFASLYGIGEVLDPAHVRSTLESIYRYNFFPNLREFANPWRTFCLNDEGGCVICTWPKGHEKPILPLPYNSETMTGFEWAAAVHMAMVGMTDQAVKLASAIRDRYDGAKRNPWNEIECGSNYARSMASFAMLQAFSGFRYDMTRGWLAFAPILPGDFRCFWSLGTIWGEYRREGNKHTLSILHGKATLCAFSIPGATSVRNGRHKLAATCQNGELRLARPLALQ
ncbi:MAG: hypothetical protein IJJ26_04980, partial [Victivallales bacterium]|nr:hypothetical protein [Victivallales bacterium]